MAEGGTIDAMLAKVVEELDEEAKRWTEVGLPGPKAMFRMGDDEFMHHVHVLAITKIIRDKFGMTEKECDLYLKRTFLEEMRGMYELAIEAKANAIRNQLLNGVNIVPPKDI